MSIPPEINEQKLQELNEAVEFTKQLDEKIQKFNLSSAQVAEKWQQKVQNKDKQDKN
ncbi:MAG: hypothetical protein ACFCU5_20060 [Pleurocapsa sp.]